jgi:hypothetical protein
MQPNYWWRLKMILNQYALSVALIIYPIFSEISKG